MAENPGRSGPLSGVRIVEFEAIGPAPLAGMLLADMGAEVVQIIRPRHAASPYEDVGAAVLYRGRLQVELDLKREREAALALMAHADAVIEGLRPGVMERLGLGPDDGLAANPRLVYGRMTGWGQHGPLARAPGHDINYLGLTGVLGAIGPADAPPPPPLNLIGDYAGGAMFLVMGLLAALLEAREIGRGQVVDAAIIDGVAALSAMFQAFRTTGGWNDRRGDNLLDGGRPFYRCYACADGRYVAVGALEPAFYSRLLDGLGLDPADYPQEDPAGWPRMEAKFARRFAERSRDEWAAAFEGREACVTPVLGWGEAHEHPHNVARETFITRDGVTQPAPAPRFSTTTATVTNPPRALGIEELLDRWKERN